MTMKVKCPYCGKVFRNLYNLKNHFRQVHRDIEYCCICNRQFKSFLGLMMHIRNRGDTAHIALGLLAENNNSQFIKTLKIENNYNLHKYYEFLREALCNPERGGKLKKKSRIQCNTW
ncbi:MAG: hypothetical protein DRJ18_01440 [Candidatus Methanomethylicota archaeon]|nr:MAG: hypothetical protein DRJ18_01440 [Candidatus Verstraetearchaeota archaeon]